MCRKGRIWLKQSGVKHFAGSLPEAEQKLVLCDAGRRRWQTSSTKGRGHSVERQAELVCPRHPGPDGSPGSATFCLETDEGRHDRSHVISRSHAIAAGCGPRCHPQGREHGLSVLIPVVQFRLQPIAAPDVCDGVPVARSRHRIPSTSVGQPTEPCFRVPCNIRSGLHSIFGGLWSRPPRRCERVMRWAIIGPLLLGEGQFHRPDANRLRLHRLPPRVAAHHPSPRSPFWCPMAAARLPRSASPAPAKARRCTAQGSFRCAYGPPQRR